MKYIEKNFIDEIKKALDPKYNLDTTVIQKNNGVNLLAAIVGVEGTTIRPTIYLEGFIDKLEAGSPMEDMVNDFLNAVEKSMNNLPQFDLNAFHDWDVVKRFVEPKLVNFENNREYLSSKAFMKMDDLAVMYIVDANQFSGITDLDGKATIAISKEMLAIWKIDIQDLNKAANANFRTNNEVTLMPMDAAVFSRSILEMKNYHLKDMNAEQIVDTLDGNVAPFAVLSNGTNINGATSVLNASMMDKIADAIGDFYIIPSSLHECLIIRNDPSMVIDEMNEMIKNVNDTTLDPQDILSDHVYEYNRESRQIVTARPKEQLSLSDRLAKNVFEVENNNENGLGRDALNRNER